MIKSQRIRIYPNSHMVAVIEDLFNYSRYCYNQGLEAWNSQYDASVVLEDKCLRPNNSSVRNELVTNKADWQYLRSSRVLQQAIVNLAKAWKNYFNPNMLEAKRPRFKSKKYSIPSFTTDRAKVDKGKLFLDKPKELVTSWYGIKLAEPIRFKGIIKLVTITKNAKGYFAGVCIATEDNVLAIPTENKVGVDANVKRFNYGDCQQVNIYPKSLDLYYKRIAHYQKVIARKRLEHPTSFRSNNYVVVRTKLQRDYLKVSQVQGDILHKFTSKLTKTYAEIHIEDLDVKHMQMSSKMGKNLHRSLFGRLREQLTYKCGWYGNKLVIVPRLYPSTQLCSECGFRKTSDGYGGKQTLSGDSIHHEHQTYYCYNCGAILDRDENAVSNIKNYEP